MEINSPIGEGYVLPHKIALHDAIRKELRWQDEETFIEPQLSLIREQAIAERYHTLAEGQPGNTDVGS